MSAGSHELSVNIGSNALAEDITRLEKVLQDIRGAGSSSTSLGTGAVRVIEDPKAKDRAEKAQKTMEQGNKGMMDGFGGMIKGLLPLVGIGAGIGFLTDNMLKSSGILQSQLRLWEVINTLVFKPFGDFIGETMRPSLMQLLRFARYFNAVWGPKMLEAGKIAGENLRENTTIKGPGGEDVQIPPVGVGVFGITQIIKHLQDFGDYLAGINLIQQAYADTTGTTTSKITEMGNVLDTLFSEQGPPPGTTLQTHLTTLMDSMFGGEQGPQLPEGFTNLSTAVDMAKASFEAWQTAVDNANTNYDPQKFYEDHLEWYRSLGYDMLEFRDQVNQELAATSVDGGGDGDIIIPTHATHDNPNARADIRAQQVDWERVLDDLAQDRFGEQYAEDPEAAKAMMQDVVTQMAEQIGLTYVELIERMAQSAVGRDSTIGNIYKDLEATILESIHFQQGLGAYSGLGWKHDTAAAWAGTSDWKMPYVLNDRSSGDRLKRYEFTDQSGVNFDQLIAEMGDFYHRQGDEYLRFFEGVQYDIQDGIIQGIKSLSDESLNIGFGEGFMQNFLDIVAQHRATPFEEQSGSTQEFIRGIWGWLQNEAGFNAPEGRNLGGLIDSGLIDGSLQATVDNWVETASAQAAEEAAARDELTQAVAEQTALDEVVGNTLNQSLKDQTTTVGSKLDTVNHNLTALNNTVGALDLTVDVTVDASGQ